MGTADGREVFFVSDCTLSTFCLKEGDWKWRFSPERPGRRGEEIIGVVAGRSGKTAVITESCPHFPCGDERQFGWRGASDSIRDVVAAGHTTDFFVALTEHDMRMYDMGGRSVWSEHLARAPNLLQCILSGRTGKFQAGAYCLAHVVRYMSFGLIWISEERCD